MATSRPLSGEMIAGFQPNVPDSDRLPQDTSHEGSGRVLVGRCGGHSRRVPVATVVATLIPLVAVALLFALDPGGAIAESGFPDYRGMDWKQLLVWGFRTIGVGVGLLILVGLGLRYRSPLKDLESYRKPGPSAALQSSSLPAAAVSVLLEERMVSGRTLLASIVEMCQRGTLQVECSGAWDGYKYQLFQQGPPQYDWERVIVNRLPSDPSTVRELHDRLREREDAIGHQLGEFLQRQGLFHDNPVRVFREHYGDGVGMAMLAGALLGSGAGLWLALWVSQWWVDSLVGAVIGSIYWIAATPMSPGVLAPTDAGADEIGQWLALKDSLTGPGREDGWSEPDSTLAYAVALDAARPWLDASIPAPPWFGQGEASSVRGPGLDVAYHGFMSSPAWGLADRSESAVEAAAEPVDSEESDPFQQFIEQAEDTTKSEDAGGTANEKPQTEDASPGTGTRGEAAPGPPRSPLDYRKYRPPGWVEEAKDRRGCAGWLKWPAAMLGIGALVVAAAVVINLASPAVEPCPTTSPMIPPPGQLSTLLDLFEDECTSVIGEVVSQGTGMLVVEVDRGEYTQQVLVIGPEDILGRASLGTEVHVAGRIRRHENGGPMVHFGVDRGWWGNLFE